ncbi:MAG: hypothetical protein ACLPVF_13175 [Acidimicrobiales bacterium]
MLAAIDDSEAGQSGKTLALGMCRQFEVATRIFWTGEAAGPRGARRLAGAIAGEAGRFGADVIVLGLERDRIRHRPFSKGMQAELARLTSLPVLIAPSPPGERRGPAPREPGPARV